MDIEEFLEKWKAENNTAKAVYSHYHIDAMEAYAKKEVEDYIKYYESAIDPVSYESWKENY